MTASIK